MMSDNACMHQHIGLYINPEGFLHLCGISKEKINGLERDAVHVEDVSSINDFFLSDHYSVLRNTDIHDNPLCVACTRRESNGVKSLRYMITEKYKKFGLEPNGNIQHLDICFSNLCNQQCLMCKSESSSRWYKDDVRLSEKFNRKPIKYRQWTDDNLHKIIDILPDVKILTIKGGEPIIQPEVHEMLRYLKKNNLNPRIELLTNFQDVPSDIMELLWSMDNLVLRISMDAYGEMYNWTRGGDYEKVMTNLETFCHGHPSVPDIGFTNTLSRWSYRSLCDDIVAIERRASALKYSGQINYNIQPVIGPAYASPFSDKLSERQDLIFEFEKKFGFIAGDHIDYGCLRLNHLQNVLSLEADTREWTEDLYDQSVEWGKEIDAIRAVC